MTERRRVRVWFGEYVIADYIAGSDLAAQYEQLMRRRFAGLRVTNDPLPDLPPLLVDHGPTRDRA